MATGILLETRDAFSRITLNRPESRNAVDAAMHDELEAALREADADPDTRLIMLTGAGGAFCSGGDMKSMGSTPEDRVRRRGWRLVQAMLDAEKPIIAVVEGPAIGLGLALALLSDCSIVADDALLGDPHVSVGLVAGDGCAVVLPLLLGHQRAKELLLTGRTVSGSEAAALGMVNRSVPKDQLWTTANALGEEIAAQPPFATRATKMIVNRFLRWSAHEVLDVSLALEEVSRKSPEHEQALDEWRRRRAERRQ